MPIGQGLPINGNWVQEHRLSWWYSVRGRTHMHPPQAAPGRLGLLQKGCIYFQNIFQ